MRLRVLALDYDGTIAEGGVLDARVHGALLRARGQGFTVVLVTGRILADLRRVLGDTRLFDAIVAENGAVLHFPDSRRSMLLAPSPAPTLLDELRHQDVHFLAGESVVEAHASDAERALASIRELRLPLVLIFNRDRMMILPQAVSKETGLRAALRALRLSPHDALAVGDAENDHALLRTCELGAAVAWGSAVLRASADEIVPGDGPGAVADYLEAQIARPVIDLSRLAARTVHLGVGSDGDSFDLAMRGRNVLIAGDTRSGKSWLAGLFCEQMILEHYCVCVIDPEGEYTVLEGLPSVVVLPVAGEAPAAEDLERTLRYPDVSLVLDLSAVDQEQKRGCVREIAERLIELRRRTGLPHAIVVDEAHYFLRDPALVAAVSDDPGGYLFVTWRTADLDPALPPRFHEVLTTRISSDAEAASLHALRGGASEAAVWAERLGEIAPGYAAWLPAGGERCGTPLVFRVAPRLTSHFRHRRKYLNIRVPPGLAFALQGDGGGGQVLESLNDLVRALETDVAVAGHLRRGDFSRWVREVFGDRGLAQQVERIEERWRVRELPDAKRALAETIRNRYGELAEDDPNPATPGGARRRTVH